MAVLSGYFDAAEQGEVLFCVAATEAGSSLRSWRGIQEKWLLKKIEQLGGALSKPCGQSFEFSDAFVEITNAAPQIGVRPEPPAPPTAGSSGSLGREVEARNG